MQPYPSLMAVPNSSGHVAAWCQGSWSVLQTSGDLGGPALCVCMSTVQADTTGNTAGVTRHCLGFKHNVFRNRKEDVSLHRFAVFLLLG